MKENELREILEKYFAIPLHRGWGEKGIANKVSIDKAIETKFEIIGRCDFRKIKTSLNDSLGRFDILIADEKIVQMWNVMTDALFQNQIDRVRNARSKFKSLTDIISAINHSTP